MPRSSNETGSGSDSCGGSVEVEATGSSVGSIGRGWVVRSSARPLCLDGSLSLDHTKPEPSRCLAPLHAALPFHRLIPRCCHRPAQYELRLYLRPALQRLGELILLRWRRSSVRPPQWAPSTFFPPSSSPTSLNTSPRFSTLEIYDPARSSAVRGASQPSVLCSRGSRCHATGWHLRDSAHQ